MTHTNKEAPTARTVEASKLKPIGIEDLTHE